MKPNPFGPVTPKKLKKYKNWIEGRLNAKIVFLKVGQKITLLRTNLRTVTFLSLWQMLSLGNDT